MERTENVGKLLIGNGVLATGSAYVPQCAQINGKFDGAMEAKTVIVEEQGDVSGITKAELLAVAGRISDKIRVSDTLQIESGGIASGEIAYKTIVMAKGGQVLGSLTQLRTAE